jgi:hypothetical protein
MDVAASIPPPPTASVSCAAFAPTASLPPPAVPSHPTHLQSIGVPLPPAVAENLPFHLAEVHSAVVAMCAASAASHRLHVHATPLSFLALLDAVKAALMARSERSSAQMSRLDSGLATLQRATSQVQQLAEELHRTTVRCGGETGEWREVGVELRLCRRVSGMGCVCVGGDTEGGTQAVFCLCALQ